jgi:hypothetical protein
MAFLVIRIELNTMKKNCICLSCKNLDEDFIPKGKVKCLFQIDTDETIEGALLNGETDKCPFDFYEKKDDDTWRFKNEPVISFYVDSESIPKSVPSYECQTCSNYKSGSCPAFPEGIPCGIIIANGHKQKLPGQNTDIVFKWNEDNA